MPPLPPSRNADCAAGPRRLPNQTADRVQKQVDVGRMVDVRLHHERTAAPDQRRAALFSGKLRVRPGDQLAHLAQQLRRHQLHVVADGLNLVFALVETAVAEHLPDLRVRVRQIPKPAGVAPPVGKNVLVQKREQLGPRRLVLVDRLKADQKRRGVVPRLRVELDLLDGDRPQRTPQFDDIPHAKSSEDSPIGRNRGRILPHLAIPRNRNRTIQSKDLKN